MGIELPPLLVGALAVLVWIGSSARLTRLLTQDSFPPVVRVRMAWDVKTEGSPWNDLAHCHWCLAPWVVAVMGAWGYFTSLHWSWWVASVWLTVAYATSWTVHHDED